MDKPLINLITNPYKSDNVDRQEELNFCELHNKHNPCIGYRTRMYGRPTIREMICESMPGVLNVLANSDIIFDDTLLLALEHCKANTNDVLALCRYDMPGLPASIESTPAMMVQSTFFERSDSQDVWMWWGQIYIHPAYGKYTLGLPGCDNALAYEFQQAGYNLIPASRTIKTYHIHSTNIRTYDRSQTVPPPYLTLQPTTL